MIENNTVENLGWLTEQSKTITKTILSELVAKVAEISEIESKINHHVDLSFCGGFFDGEGCISMSMVKRPRKDGSYGQSHRVDLTISQNQREILDRFERVLGVHKPVISKVPARNGSKPYYFLAYRDRRALEVIRRLRPYLIRKIREADYVLENFDSLEYGKHLGRKRIPQEIIERREKFRQELSRLKHIEEGEDE